MKNMVELLRPLSEAHPITHFGKTHFVENEKLDSWFLVLGSSDALEKLASQGLLQ